MSSDYAVEETDEPTTNAGYRSYEVYQRERVGETTNLVNPRELIADSYLGDPFTVPGVLRENYPCYRDWIGNRFWVTRYDDVTSVFVDDANYETRPATAGYGEDVSGVDLGGASEIAEGWVAMHDSTLELTLADLVAPSTDAVDLAVLADHLQVKLLATVLGTADATAEILDLVRVVRAGTGWDERARVDGLAAFRQLRQLLAEHLAPRRQTPAGDLLTVFVDLDAASDDVAMTLVEADLATLPASLANLWCLLLTHPDQFDVVRAEPRMMKFAYLEALRHSPPHPTTDRFTRHEVERFGRLLPNGALIHLSGAAANRDPRQFADPDTFNVSRKDLCRREPRGQYRADGLPAAITFGHGRPSSLPAVPRDAPRSRYALTRDIAVAASLALLDRFPDISLEPDVSPAIALDRLGGTYRCRNLPVRLT